MLSISPGQAPHKRSHYNHPSSIWARESRENYRWLLIHGLALAKEYTERYGKQHKSEKVIKWCFMHVYMLDFPKEGLTTPPYAISPDMNCRTLISDFDSLSRVEQYQLHYIMDKSHFVSFGQKERCQSGILKEQGFIMKWISNEKFAEAMEKLVHVVEDRVSKKKIVVVDLFAEAGGFSTGAVQAGAVLALAMDLWNLAMLVHHANHPHTPFIQHELGDLDADLALIRKYVQPYIDMGYHFQFLLRSPPCQALSNASSRDPREGLPMVMHYLDLVEMLQPDSWSMENVVPVRRFLPEDIPSVVLDSADFGVPQRRRRCFVKKVGQSRRLTTINN